MASAPKKTLKKTREPRKVHVRQGDLVIVTWMDACADIGWDDHREQRLAPAHCRSVGWVGATKDPKAYLILYADRAHDEKNDHDSNRRIAIPSGWITGIKRVRE